MKKVIEKNHNEYLISFNQEEAEYHGLYNGCKVDIELFVLPSEPLPKSSNADFNIEFLAEKVKELIMKEMKTLPTADVLPVPVQLPVQVPEDEDVPDEFSLGDVLSDLEGFPEIEPKPKPKSKHPAKKHGRN